MLVKKSGCVYIITNTIHTVLYVGVTSNLPQRILQHINKFYPASFTAKYNCNKLVWYESFASISEAIAREKQLKAGSRAKKIGLIKELNPDWKDLWEEDVRHW
jgi:putative endonuclease